MPFSIDTSVPADSGIVSQYPAQARTFKSTVDSWIDVEHDLGEGRHKFGIGTTSARDAITTWVAGSVWINTDLGGVLQYVESTGPFVWKTLDGNATGALLWMLGDTAPSGGADPAVAGNLWVPAWDGDEVAQSDFPDLATYFGYTGTPGDAAWDNFDGQSNPGAGNFRLPKIAEFVIYGFDSAAGSVASVVSADTFKLVEAQLPQLTHTVNDPGHTHSYKFGQSSAGSQRPRDNQAPANDLQTGSSTTGITVDAHGQSTPDDVDRRQKGVSLKPWVRT